MPKTKKRLIIIDSNSVIYRAYHALPPLTTKSGELINAVYGFLLVFLKVLKEFQPDYVVAAFDLPGPTFRHKEFKEYKAKRPPTPKELSQQIPKVKEVLRSFNIPVFEKEGFEADDLIGTISKLVSRKKTTSEVEIIILSGDLDTLQLVDEKTKVYALKRGLKDAILYDEKTVWEKYGFSPSQLIDFKALRGDPSDNIPGVLGIGEKTAVQLIKQFGSLETLYREIEKETERAKEIKLSIREKLIRSKKQAFLSKALSQIRRDALTNFDFEKCRWGNYNNEKVIQHFKDLEFYSLIERLEKIKKNKAENAQRLLL